MTSQPHQMDVSRDASTSSNPTRNMPSISEDDTVADKDEPADPSFFATKFSKTMPVPSGQSRKNSMLTKALHTDSESHTESYDESLGFSSFRRQPSRSSTCSTWSARSDFTGSDGRLSTSSSPSRAIVFRKPDFVAEPETISHSKEPSPARLSVDSKTKQRPSPAKSDDSTEEKLARRRCITFACGAAKKPGRDESVDAKPPPRAATDTVVAEQPKRPCSIKFACPSKISFSGLCKEKASKVARTPSPQPTIRGKSPSPYPIRLRPHRDSDSTIKEESPKASRKVPALEPRKIAPVDVDDLEHTEESSFSAFASKDQKVDEWTEENTCHKSRLTVADTLGKEKDLQQLGEEAAEEAADEEDDLEYDDGLSDDDEQVSEGGFDTDDEEGFAESDDDDDGDSDYEWWAPRKSHSDYASARLAPGDDIRRPALHADSDDSYESSISPRKSRGSMREVTPRRKHSKSKVAPVTIRPGTPELPDSTDFVCGTLDEDKPLEEAYASAIQQRKAATKYVRPQDIDPTFPTDIASDDDEEQQNRDDSDNPHFMHGPIEGLDEESIRGRSMHSRGRSPRLSPAPQPAKQRSPLPPPASIMAAQRHKSPMPPPSHAALQRRPKSPAPVAKRLKSPAPAAKRPKSPAPVSKRTKSPMLTVNTSIKLPAKKGQVLRSPPPRGMFGRSPHRVGTPSQKHVSPAPSRRGTPPDFLPAPLGFLGQRPSLTHTSSLPRSPNVFAKKRIPYDSATPDFTKADDEFDDAEDTAKENKVYERSAVDIVQGLEHKRLRRRQKFYERYCRKEEKKAQRREKIESRRLQPGKGAQRMRQVGIDCAVYRGKRVLSI